MLEDICLSSKKLDYTILDELNSIECESSNSLKEFLNSLEMFA